MSLSSSGLSCTDISKRFSVRRRGGGTGVQALSDVSLHVATGETVAIVGESGSGKTTLGRICVALESADDGSVELDGAALDHLRGRALRRFHQKVQMIYQDPYASLDPRYTVGRSVMEPLRFVTGLKDAERRRRVAEALEMVGLTPGAHYAELYPHHLSGGQRQRVAIARAIVSRPAFIVADEPVSMLDVSLQAGVLALLRRLQAELGCGYVFITHDLGVARYIADRVMVIYRGRIVESGPCEAIMAAPQHPYTRLLLTIARGDDAFDPDGGLRRRGVTNTNTPAEAGCAFEPRCPYATAACRAAVPELTSSGQRRSVACYNAATVSSLSGGHSEGGR